MREIIDEGVNFVTTAISTFDSTKMGLLDLLKDIKIGKTQLPDFQRGWVWDDDRIKNLLASVSLAFPIGSILLLETGNDSTRFKPRPVEGVTDVPTEPEKLILDGQQRLTSLFQSLLSENPVLTHDIRKKEIKRHYFINVFEAIKNDSDREDAIISLPEDLKLRNFRGEVTADYSTLELQCKAGLLYLPYIFNNGIWEWQNTFMTQDTISQAEKWDTWGKINSEIIQRFQQYQFPVITLKKETKKEAVCLVFEKVNTGGVTLTVFELLTATYAAEDFDLRNDWFSQKRKFKNHPQLGNLQNDDYLAAITLLSTYEAHKQDNTKGVSCKRRDILRLSLSNYKKYAEMISNGFITASKFLMSQNFYKAKDIPYRTQLIPLAAIFSALGDEAEQDTIKQYISQWYWCGVFGELYGSANETRFAKDLPEVLSWIEGKDEPTTVKDCNFSPNRLHTLRTRNSAAYKGVYALLMHEGCMDFRTGDTIGLSTFYDENIDIHHIFPVKYCNDNEIAESDYNSIINKSPLSYKTNRIIGGNAPSIYLEKLQKSTRITEDRMNKILYSHLIDPATLKSNDFSLFFSKRKESLLSLISKAIGKKIESLQLNNDLIFTNQDGETN